MNNGNDKSSKRVIKTFIFILISIIIILLLIKACFNFRVDNKGIKIINIKQSVDSFFDDEFYVSDLKNNHKYHYDITIHNYLDEDYYLYKVEINNKNVNYDELLKLLKHGKDTKFRFNIKSLKNIPGKTRIKFYYGKLKEIYVGDDVLSVFGDEKVKLPKGKDKDGYRFLGYTDKEGSNKVKYKAEKEYNLKDGTKLYPVYEEIKENPETGGKTKPTDNNGNNNNTNNNEDNTKPTEKAKYIVTFDYQNGTPSTTKEVTNTEKYGTLPTAVKTGYYFVGWYLGDQKITSESIVDLTSNVTLKAKYVIINYSINYDLDGGSSSNPSSYTIESNDIVLSDASKEGFDFVGWTGSNGNTPEKDVTITKGSTGNKSYKANYTTHELVNYKVKHKQEQLDGSYNTVKEETYNAPYGSKVTPSVKTYEGFTSPQPIEITVKQDGSSEVEYKYKRKLYTFTLNDSEDVISSHPSGDYPYETEITLTAKEKDGYDFSSWSNGDTNQSTTITLTENTSIRPIYTPKTYEAVFNSNTGSGTMPNQLFTYDEEKKLSKNLFTKTGNKFIGWNTKADGTGTPYLDEAVVKNLTTSGTIDLYAQFIPETYTISFNTDGGEELFSIERTYGETYGTLPTPNKPGYEFTGWFNGDQKIESDTVVDITSDITLKARYNIITYTITYTLDGGSATNPGTYTVEDTITLNNPTKTGYTFSGWTGSNGSALQTEVTINKGSTGNKNYTAHYSTNQNTKYVVKHLKQKLSLDGYDLEETETLYGASDTKVTPETKVYTGFTAPTKQEITIKADGTTELEYKYQREMYTYTVSDSENMTSSLPSGDYPYGTEVTVTADTVPGYTFDSWSNGETDNPSTFIIDDDINISPIYTANKYYVVFNNNTGSGSMADQEMAYDTDEVLNKATFTKAGYNFKNWNTKADGEGTTYADEATVRNLAESGNVILYAIWQARTDINYKVIVRKQNLDLTTYTETESIYTGTTDTEVTPEVIDYTGYVSPQPQTITITGDGSASVTYTYTREMYTYTIQDSDKVTSSLPSGDYPYGTEITVTANTVPGYTFSGWSDGENDNPRVITLDGDITIRPTYTANTNTSYTVKHYKQKITLDGYDLADTDNLTGTTDAEVTPSVKNYTGFTAPSTQTVTIKGDGSTEVIYNYTRNIYTYTVENPESMTSSLPSGDYPYGTEITVTANTVPGYTFSGWSDGNTDNPRTIILENNLSIEPTYTANTNTSYTVKHYKQKVTLDGYDLAETDNLTGTTDTKVTPNVKTYTGFDSPVPTEVTIKGDGSTEVTYNYTRKSYTFTLNDSEDVTSSHPSGSYPYETEITLTANNKEGYTFVGWSNGDTNQTTTITLTDNIEISPVYSSNTDTAYTVVHKQMNIDGEGYTTKETEILHGTTGSKVTPSVKNYTGFTSPEPEEITIKADGSASVTYNYSRNKYDFAVSDRTYIDEDYSTKNGKYYYQTEISVKATNRTGYTFTGWSNGDNTLTTTFNLDDDTTITPSYTANKYNVVFNSNTGSGSMSDQEMTYDTKANLTKNTFTKLGYTFAGWNIEPDGTGATYTDEAEVQNLTTSGNVILYAQWVANQDTPYKVIIRKENVDGETYTTTETTYTGTTDTQITPVVVDYTGYVSPQAQTITITSDGNASVTYTYNRIRCTFNLTDTENVTSSHPNGEYPYGTEITLTAGNVEGYTFTGWSNGETSNPLVITLNDDIEISPVYEVVSDVQYKVVHRKQKVTLDGYDVEEEITGTGQAGDSITPSVKTYTGFTSPQTQTTTIAGDGSTVVTYNYDRISYTLTYDNTTDIDTTLSTPEGTYPYEYEVTLKAKDIPGYTFAGWSDGSDGNPLVFDLTSNVTIKPLYVANNDTIYKVIHRKMNVDGVTYVDEVEERFGTTDTSITPSVKTYTGFTSPQTQTTNINGDGSTEVVYVYTRIMYTLTLQDTEYIEEGDLSGSYPYGAELTLTAVDRQNYEFTNWSNNSTDNPTTITITGNITIKPIYTSNSYTVHFDANGGSGSMDDQVISKDVKTKLTTNEFTKSGSIFDSWNTEPDGTGTRFYDEEEVLNITNNDTINLYAIWAPSDKVARIGNTYYTKLATAISNVPTTGEETEVVLLKDTAERAEIPTTKNVVINLQNHTLSNNGNLNVVVNNGTLKLLNGTITTNVAQGAINNNSTGTMVVDGTHIIVSKTTSKQALYNDGGTLTLNNVYFSSESNIRATLHNLNNGSINLNSGTIISTSIYAIYNENGTLNIGVKDGNIKDSPIIQGKTYGIIANSTYKFYDGIIKGSTYHAGKTSNTGNTPSISNDVDETKISEIETDSTKVLGTEDIGGVTYKTLKLELTTPTPTMYTVTFNPNGGTVSEKTRQVESGEKVGNLPTPSKNNNHFDGWFTESTDGTEITKDTIINNDVTFYAHWTPTIDNALINPIRIAMKIDEERQIDVTGPQGMESVTYTSNDTNVVTVDSTGKVTGIGAGITTITVTGSISGLTKTITVEVLPTKKYKVTFNPNGGQISETIRFVHEGTAIGDLPTGTKGNLVVEGWYLDITTGVKIEPNYIVNNDIVLTAKWKEKESIFDTGRNVVTKFKKLAGNPSATYNSINDNITNITKSTTQPDISQITDDNIVSSPVSDYPIYAWFDNGTINWWSEADVDYLNEDASYMFNNLTAVTSFDIDSISSIKTTNMSGMFNNCASLETLDLSSFDTSKVTSMSAMFCNMTSLESITVSDDFVVSQVTSSGEMFNGDINLVGGQGTVYSEDHIDKEYAHYDMGDSFPGYFNTKSLANKYIISFKHGDKLVDYKYIDRGSPIGDLPVYAETGYTFNYWMVNNNQIDNTYVPTQNTTVYANMTAKEYTISFESNGGTEISSYTREYGTEVGPLPTPTKDGNTFVGWYKNSNLTNEVTSDTIVTGDMKLYAKWGIKTITFDANNGEFEQDISTNLIKYYNNNYYDNTSYKEPTREGYLFTGWNTKIDGTGTNYSNEQAVLNSVNVLYDKTLHAQWIEAKASFSNGQWVNRRIGSLAGDASNIISIQKSTTKPDISEMTNSNIVSYNNGIFNTPIYMWYDNGTMYWWTEASKVYFNQDCTNFFSGFSSLTSLDLSDFDASDVTRMTGMFEDCESLTSLDLSSFNPSNLTEMAWSFEGCTSLTSLDLSDLNTSNVTEMIALFNNCTNLKSINFGNSFDVSKVKRMNYMFAYCRNLISLDLSSFNPSSVTTTEQMFYCCENLKNINFGNNFDTKNVTVMTDMFAYCSSLTSLDLSSFNTINVKLMTNMFGNCSSLTSIYFSSNFDTSNVTNMGSMFGNCSSLTSLDLSSFNTTNVTNMNAMFRGCTSLISLDLSSFDPCNVTGMNSMFYECRGLTSINFGNEFDTGNVTEMESMFYYCDNLTSLDLSSFDPRSVTTFWRMFYNCTSLTSINLSSFNTTNAKKMRAMFSYCKSLTSLDLSSFDTSNVTEMESMFDNCKSLITLDLSSFNTSNLVTMEKMFNECNNLTTIYASYNFVTTKVKTSNWIFYHCTSLVGGWGTKVNLDSKEYARIDEYNGNPGYFTAKDGWVLQNRSSIDPPADHLLEQEWVYYDNGEKIEHGFHLLNDLYGNEQKYYFVNGVAHLGWLNYEGDYYYLSTEDDDGDGQSNGYVNANAYRSVIKNIDGVDYEFDSEGRCINYNGQEFYTIVFDANGGTVSPTYINLNQGSALGTLPVPTRTGYEFLGWWTDIQGGIQVTSETVPNSSARYIAKWEYEKLVTFKSNGGIFENNEETNIIKYYIDSYVDNTSYKEPTKSNYSFDGWNTKADGTGTHYDDESEVLDNIYSLHNKKLYAQWIEAQATFDIGKNVNAKMKKLAGNSSATYTSINTNVYSIQKSSTSPDISQMTDKNIVSASSSLVPIYMWYSSGTLYWWSEDDTPYLNEDSSLLFHSFKGLTSIDLNNFVTKKVKNMAYMFSYCDGLTSLDLGNNFDTSKVTKMHSMFDSCKNLTTLNLGDKFDTSNVTSMGSMFYNCKSLTTLILGNLFNTRKVTSMYEMFDRCENLVTLNLGSNYDTSSVTNMNNMFAYCNSLTSLDLGNKFNTSNVTNMSGMFLGCSGLTSLDLGNNFDTSNVTEMSGMFRGCSSLTSLDLGNDFDTSNVIYLMGIFENCSSLTTIDLGDKFDTSNVTGMSSMFYGCSSLTSIDLGDKFDTSNVNYTGAMFSGCTNLTTIDLGDKFDTSKVTNMKEMFYNCTNLTTIYATNLFTTSALNEDRSMFENDINLVGGMGTTYDSNYVGKTYAHIDEGSSNPGYFTDRNSVKIKFDPNGGSGTMNDQVVSYNSSITLNENTYTYTGYAFIGWNTKADGTGTGYIDKANVVVKGNMKLYAQWMIPYAMFDTGLNLNAKMKKLAGNSSATYDSTDTNILSIQKSTTKPDISQMTADNIVSVSNNIYTTSIYMWFDNGIIYWWSEDDTPSLNTNSSHLFQHLRGASSIDLNYIDTSQVTDMSYMFDDCKIDSLDLSSFDTSQVTDMSYMFNLCVKLTNLNFGNNFDTSNVVNMVYIFKGCIRLTELDLGDNFDTSKVTNMTYMFADCNSLTSLDLGDKFDTSNVINMNYMFYDCNSLTSLDLGNNFDTSSSGGMYAMFEGCSSLERLDLGNHFDTTNVTTMDGMFGGCSSLERLDLGNHFDTRNVTMMQYMFNGCTSLTVLDLGDNFDTGKVKSMYSMFESCSSLERLDLGNHFDTRNVTMMYQMFYNCSNLTTIYATNAFVTTSVTAVSNSIGMFSGDTKLVGGLGTLYNSSKTNKIYAHLDGGPSNPGYFTDKNPVSITFDNNGGSGVMTNQTLSIGISTSIKLNEFNRLGHLFAGWNTKEDGTGTAYSDGESVTITGSIILYAQWMEVNAMFDTGQNVNAKMKKLAGNSSATYSSQDNNITSIQRSLVKPNTSSFTDDNIVSIDNETYNTPIYMWYDNGTIYWWSEDIKPSLNSDSSYLFNNLKSLASLDLDNNYDIDNVTNMESMFADCSSLISLDLGDNFDTSKVTNMTGMFGGCNSLTSLDLGDKFDTSQVTDMFVMFSSCNSLTSLDLGDKFNTSQVTRMSGMFSYCNGLTSLDLGEKFDTSQVTEMEIMFQNCRNLTNLNLGEKFDTSRVTNMFQMFKNCDNLTTVYATDLFDTSSVTSSLYMFNGVTNIVGGLGTVFNSSKKDKTYARIDKAGIPGYFTDKTAIGIDFDANGGTGTMSMQVIDSTVSNTLNSNTFTRNNYTFTGWNTASDGSGTSYSDEATISAGTINKYTKLYAQWSENQISIIYEANGGIGTMANQPYGINSSVTLNANSFTRSGDDYGYEFVEWNTASDGSGTSYSDGATIPANTYSADVRLYAQWRLHGWQLVNSVSVQPPQDHLLDQQWSYYEHGVIKADGLQTLPDLYGINQIYYIKNGVAQMDWQEIDGNWYYFDIHDPDDNHYTNCNAYVDGWYEIGGVNYQFDSNGVCLNPNANSNLGSSVFGILHKFDIEHKSLGIILIISLGVLSTLYAIYRIVINRKRINN